MPNPFNPSSAAPSLLVMMRHGQSEWNAQDRFTGFANPPLTTKGEDEARSVGQRFAASGVVFDVAFTSLLDRAQRTLALVLGEMGCPNLPYHADFALNERDYGELTGLNKEENRKKFGIEQVETWRKTYEGTPPGGESLRQVAENRILPFFKAYISPLLNDGKNVLIVAHGNTLRALAMKLEGVAPADVPHLNISTGEPRVYLCAAGVYTYLGSDVNVALGQLAKHKVA